MLEQDLKDQLGHYLTRLTGDVEITAFVDDSAESSQMLDLLADISAASSRVTIKEARDASERAPSFALARPGEAVKPR
jgi:alkyl hydroperoxide reductase subunit F